MLQTTRFCFSSFSSNPLVVHLVFTRYYQASSREPRACIMYESSANNTTKINSVLNPDKKKTAYIGGTFITSCSHLASFSLPPLLKKGVWKLFANTLTPSQINKIRKIHGLSLWLLYTQSFQVGHHADCNESSLV